MGSEGPARAFETPLNMSDYVNFDLIDDIPNPTVGSSPSSSVAEHPQDMCIDDSYVGFDAAEETVIARMFESTDGSNALGFESDTVAIASAESGETDAAFRDFNTLSPTSEDSDMTDTFQATNETDAMPDNLNMFEPMVFTNPAALQIPRSPSRWVPVSPQLQQQLNAVYATQLSQLVADPNPPPVLYLPAEGPCASPTPSSWSTPNDHLPRTESAQILQLNAQPLSVDPSLSLRRKGEVPSARSSPSGTYQPILPTTDNYVSNDEVPELTPIKKHTLDVSDSNSEPATKRTKTANPLTTIVKNISFNGEDDAEMRRAQSSRHNTAPATAKDKHSVDASDEDNPNSESDDSDSSGSSSAPSVPLSGNPKWRYEHAKETRLRNQRRKEWNRRRTNGTNAKGEAPNRKMQKLLEEIEDTVEFAETQGYEVGEGVGGDGILRRSTRKGARKNYAGQE